MTTRTPTASTRFLTRLSTLVLVAAIAFGGFGLVGAVFGFGLSGHDVGVHTEVPGSRLSGLPKGAMPPDNVDVIVRVRHASAGQIRLLAARDLAPGLVLIAAIWLLRGLLVSVREGDPFNEHNVNRLRTLAVVVLAGVPLAAFVSSVFAGELADSAGLKGAGTHVPFPGNAVVGGLALFVLAEVFAAGVRLRADLDGTV
ncbi:MAG: DUF2975 domain-containing protein [Actinobacteria bacterium]|nr:DUF2975 domain-containing protein [Actinomycetota bacterium]